MNKELTVYLRDRNDTALDEIQETVEILWSYTGNEKELCSAISYLASATEILANIIENLIKYGDTND